MKNFFKKLIAPLAIATLLLAGCTDDKKKDPEPPAPRYTAASAIDAVAEAFSAILTSPIEATHDEEGDYIALNFGDSVDIDTMKGITTTYLIPDGFTTEMEDWETDAFDDGTPVDYIDYTCEKVGLEYLVVDYSGNTIFEAIAFDIVEE